MERQVIAWFSRRDRAVDALASLSEDSRTGARLIEDGEELGQLGLMNAEGGASGAAVAAYTSAPAALMARLSACGAEQVREGAPPERCAGETFRDTLGPAHAAPRNARFSPTFDEYAGAAAAGGAEMLGGRDPRDYAGAREAVAFGQRLAREGRFAGCDWASIEDQVRAEWARTGRGGWDIAAPLIADGWEEVRGMG